MNPVLPIAGFKECLNGHSPARRMKVYCESGWADIGVANVPNVTCDSIRVLAFSCNEGRCTSREQDPGGRTRGVLFAWAWTDTDSSAWMNEQPDASKRERISSSHQPDCAFCHGARNYDAATL